MPAMSTKPTISGVYSNFMVRMHVVRAGQNQWTLDIVCKPVHDRYGILIELDVRRGGLRVGHQRAGWSVFLWPCCLMWLRQVVNI